MKFVFAALAILSITAFAHEHDSLNHTLMSIQANDLVKDFLLANDVDVFGINA